MSPDRAARTVPRTLRGLARVLPGLALVAVAACGAADDDVGTIGRTRDVEFLAQSDTPTPSPDPTAPGGPVELSDAPSDPVESSAPSEPDALRIPAIGVRAPVVGVDSRPDRILMPPRDPDVVGWWGEGAAPGDAAGSAILVGHTVRSGGGVFDDIGELGTGDTIEVDELVYRVQSVEVLTKEDVARRAEELFDQSVSGRLVVVTCEDWDGETWRSNIVAIATPA